MHSANKLAPRDAQKTRAPLGKALYTRMNRILNFIIIFLLLNSGVSLACSELEIPYTVEKTWKVAPDQKDIPELYIVTLPVAHGGLKFSALNFLENGIIIPVATKPSKEAHHIQANVMLSLNALQNITIEAGYNLESDKHFDRALCQKYQEIKFGI